METAPMCRVVAERHDGGLGPPRRTDHPVVLADGYARVATRRPVLEVNMHFSQLRSGCECHGLCLASTTAGAFGQLLLAHVRGDVFRPTASVGGASPAR